MAYTDTEPTVIGTSYTDESANSVVHTDTEPSAIGTSFTGETVNSAGYIQTEPTGAGFSAPGGDEHDHGAGSPITEYTDNEDV